jgi:hypothetical protein
MTTNNHYRGKMTAAGVLLLVIGAIAGGMVQDFRNSPVIDATLSEGMRALRADVARLERGQAQMQRTVNTLSERVAVMEAHDSNLQGRVETLKDWVIRHSGEKP